MATKRPMHLPEQFSNQTEPVTIPEGVDVIDLLRFVARSIVTINANGRKMDKKCLLCAQARLHKEKCRHDEIWALSK